MTEVMMPDDASLSDYLFALRRTASPARLGAAIGAGALVAAVGLFLGQKFAALTGLGLAISGAGAWARLNQMADGMLDGGFAAQPPALARRLRAAGMVGFAAGAVGALLVFYSIVIRFLFGATGM